MPLLLNFENTLSIFHAIHNKIVLNGKYIIVMENLFFLLSGMLLAHEKLSGSFHSEYKGEVLILVLGFYGKQNAGDNLFIDAFKFLFPEQCFKFVDCINHNDLLNTSTVFIGGGSFLDTDPAVDEDCFELL